MRRYRRSLSYPVLSRVACWFAVLLTLGLSLAYMATHSVLPKINHTHTTANLIPETSQPGSPKLRKNYPYSVIPGGVENADELRAAIQGDPVVSHHYRDFQVDRAVQIRFRGEKPAYVSYRIGKRVYWTARPIMLNPDERVLTDGSRFVRTRCGNQISFIRQSPVDTAEEPNEFAMDFIPDLPSIPVGSLDWLPSQAEPIALNPELIVTTPDPLPMMVTSNQQRKRRQWLDSGSPAPEPSTWLSFGGGALFLFWLSARCKKLKG